MMYYYGNYFSPSHFFFGPIFMIIVWAFIIWAIVSIVRHLTGNIRGDSGKALDILKERYSKGEINKEQFESMKKDIS